MREECLQQLSYNQQQRLEAETAQERGTPTAGLTKSHEHEAIDPQTPLFHRAAVHKKIEKFHKGLGSLQVSRGSTCLEMKSECGVCTLSPYRIDMCIYVGRYIKVKWLCDHILVNVQIPARTEMSDKDDYRFLFCFKLFPTVSSISNLSLISLFTFFLSLSLSSLFSINSPFSSSALSPSLTHLTCPPTIGI